jgi:hypothetical protein
MANSNEMTVLLVSLDLWHLGSVRRETLMPAV